MAKAFYTDLSMRIQDIIEQAQEDLKIAVAWFTNPFLFKVVKNMLDKVAIKIVISDSAHNFGKLDFQKLQDEGAEVYVCNSALGRFMHNKFCIVDDRLAFSGSYNWSLNAENYFENIIVAEGDAVIVPLTRLFNKIIEHSKRFGETFGRNEEVQAIEAREDNYFYNLQLQFEARVQQSIDQTVQHGLPIDVQNLYRLIDKYSAVGVAKMLTSSKQGTNLQTGFMNLAREGQLNLTFEYLVALPEFAPLFPPEIIQYANNKLEIGRIEAMLPPPPKNKRR